MRVQRFEIADLRIKEKMRFEIASPGLFEEFLYSFSQLIQ
jgi:hypothetical protein